MICHVIWNIRLYNEIWTLALCKQQTSIKGEEIRYVAHLHNILQRIISFHFISNKLEVKDEYAYWQTEEAHAIYIYANLVQESAFCAIMIWLTFYPNLILSKMLSWKFHPSHPRAYHHKCPLNHTLPYGRSNFQNDFFAILIADSDSWQKTAWRNYLSFPNILRGSWSNKPKTKKIESKLE